MYPKFKDFIDWERISYTPGLSMKFIRRYKDKVDWDELAFNKKWIK